jgi:hypothetical protein
MSDDEELEAAIRELYAVIRDLEELEEEWRRFKAEQGDRPLPAHLVAFFEGPTLH